MKQTLVSAIIFSLVFICSCKKNTTSVTEPDAAGVWKNITVDSSYKKWSHWPNHRGMQSGKAPHGPLHKVFVNNLALTTSKPPLPDGAIVVKENYSKAKQLKAITIMKKISGYNPDGGDWYWVKYSPEGKADKAGKVAGCINCHKAHADNDYVFVHRIK